MSRTHKILSIFALTIMLVFAFAAPARAFDGRTGDQVLVKEGETVNDDLYVAANNFVLDGIVKGDLLVVGQTITINGTVEGDLMAAAQTIVIHGTVTDDVRIAGSILQIGGEASIGGDVVAAGAGLETKEGSVINGEVVVASGQALLAGEVDGDILAGAGSLELKGSFGGNVEASVGDEETSAGMPPTLFMPQTGVSMPVIPPGLTIDENARIKGNLKYTATQALEIPSGAVAGKVTHLTPAVEAIKEETPAQKAAAWSLELLRNAVTLILFGLLLGWLAPMFMKSLMNKMQATPWPSLGWGVVSYAAFFFALLVLAIAVILGMAIFGTLTLGKISGTIFWAGLLILFALVFGFIVAASFVTKIAAGWLGGRMILGRIKPELAEHKVWPLVIGILLVAILIALPYLGWVFNWLITFLGLGALWMWGRERFAKPVAA